jgi:hypothetical protein
MSQNIQRVLVIQLLEHSDPVMTYCMNLILSLKIFV